jgi:hypothetical protein
MSDRDNPAIQHDDGAAQKIAAEWKLEFRESSAVAVDPRALDVLPGGDCRRLRAVPLGLLGGNAVVGLAAPSEERFASIREITGAETRFVVIAERTLEALLHSRMFADRSVTAGPTEPRAQIEPDPVPTRPSAAAELDLLEDELRLNELAAYEPELEREASPAPKPVVDEPEHRPAPPPPTPPAPPAAPVMTAATEASIVDAIVSALENRLAPAVPAAVPDAPPGDASPPELLAQVDASIAAWSTLRASLDAIGTELEETRRTLRETKEQLSVAHAENDQLQHRVRALELEVAESRGLLGDARSRLQDAFEALGGNAPRIDTEADTF